MDSLIAESDFTKYLLLEKNFLVTKGINGSIRKEIQWEIRCVPYNVETISP